MASSNNSKSSRIQRAIALMEEALGILDTLGLTLTAAKLALALDSAHKAQIANGGQ